MCFRIFLSKWLAIIEITVIGDKSTDSSVILLRFFCNEKANKNLDQQVSHNYCLKFDQKFLLYNILSIWLIENGLNWFTKNENILKNKYLFNINTCFTIRKWTNWFTYIWQKLLPILENTMNFIIPWTHSFIILVIS